MFPEWTPIKFVAIGMLPVFVMELWAFFLQYFGQFMEDIFWKSLTRKVKLFYFFDFQLTDALIYFKFCLVVPWLEPYQVCQNWGATLIFMEL